jgi:cobalt-zinc-cadmium efflux system outer membrane protein
VPLELGGKRDKRIAVAEATFAPARPKWRRRSRRVANDVRRAYYAVLVADARLMVLREQRDLAARARDAAQARFDAGARRGSRSCRPSWRCRRPRNEASAAESTSVAARTQLNALSDSPSTTRRR